MKKENKKRKYLLMLLLFLLILALLIGYILLLDSDDAEVEEENLGFGASNEPISYPEILPEDYDHTYTPEVKVDKNFTIDYKKNSADNIFSIEETSIEIPGVVFAKWSEDKSFIMFSKTETGCEGGSGRCIEDTSNIWVINPDGTGLQRILDYSKLSAIDYVSNGQTIGFVTTTEVGRVNKDGSGLEFVEEIEHNDSGSDDLHVPEIEYIDEEKFKVITDEEEISFEFAKN